MGRSMTFGSMRRHRLYQRFDGYGWRQAEGLPTLPDSESAERVAQLLRFTFTVIRHISLAIDQDGGRPDIHAIAGGYFVALIHERREGVAVPREIFAGQFGSFRVDAEDREAFFVPGTMQELDGRERFAAVSAPGTPEVQQYDFAAQTGKAHFPILQVAQREIRRGISQQRDRRFAR